VDPGYSEVLLDHFRFPRNVGMMRDADAVGESEDPTCGDLARFYLRIDGDRILEARFQTYGCGPSIAASSVATELVRGRPLEALGELTPDAVERALGGLPESRRHAATLVVDALRGAIVRYRREAGGEAHHA
jgi:nitrogen fixation NifU-like protein